MSRILRGSRDWLTVGWCLLFSGLAFAVQAGSQTPSLQARDLSAIAGIVEQEISAGHLPGAVVLVGQGDRIVYRQAFGQQALLPQAIAMQADTIFDLASLSKAVATTTAVMQLIERGKLALDIPAARYWPAFAVQGKGTITVRQLLTHSSGLPAGIDSSGTADAVLARIAAVKPKLAPGRDVIYSDLNFIVLGELVARASGEPLDAYVSRHILQPLKMQDSAYRPNGRPDAGKIGRIAPSSRPAGEVHDPLARALGGVAGNAGLFATADDLARFARCLLHGGAPILKPASVQAMLTPQSPAGTAPAGSRRGFGWKLEAPLAANRAALPLVGAASHFGYTGTALWLDPLREVYVIVLSSRLHPKDGGDATPLRARIINAVSEALGDYPAAAIAAQQPALRSWSAPFTPAPVKTPVSTGIDVLETEQFASLAGKRIALLTHRAAVDSRGRRSIDVLYRAPGVKLLRLFSAEHGLGSDHEGRIKDDSDALTGLPVYSLYGEQHRPAPALLNGLDAVVVDMQDVGVRFYTYASSVAYLMEAAAAQLVPVYILDRPNPVDASTVQGPILDSDRRSFTGYWPLPVRHGMTMGELARLFAGEAGIKVDLHVVTMQHYRRDADYTQTGLPWIAPSPNLPTLTSVALYPGVGMIEGANIAVGRGTFAPFEQVGAPWVDTRALAQSLNTLTKKNGVLAGLQFSEHSFTPGAGPYAGEICHGVKITLLDTSKLDSPALGIALASALYRLHPDHFKVEHTLGGIGAKSVIEAIKFGVPPGNIVQSVDEAAKDFSRVRQKYLIYR